MAHHRADKSKINSNFAADFRKRMVIIDDIIKPIQQEFGQYEQQLAQAFESENPLLKEILHYLAQKKGKQLRPMIILLAAKLCGKITENTLLSAVSLELLHTASLVHDDVVDTTMERRGKPSINAQWDNKVAILTGDYILSTSLENAIRTQDVKLLSVIANIGKSLSGGELLQLAGAQSGTLSEQDYFKIIRQKTAQLFIVCVEAGAISAQGTETQQQALKQFGEHLGICFQIKDDIFDFSDNTEIGKPTMNDIREGKMTLPLIKALQNAPENRRKQIEAIIKNKDFSSENLMDIKKFVHTFNGIEQSIEVMHEQKNQAQLALDFFSESEAKTALLRILDYTIERVK